MRTCLALCLPDRITLAEQERATEQIFEHEVRLQCLVGHLVLGHKQVLHHVRIADRQLYLAKKTNSYAFAVLFRLEAICEHVVHEPWVECLDCFRALCCLQIRNKIPHVTENEESCAWCNFNALLLVEGESLHSA